MRRSVRPRPSSPTWMLLTRGVFLRQSRLFSTRQTHFQSSCKLSVLRRLTHPLMVNERRLQPSGYFRSRPIAVPNLSRHETSSPDKPWKSLILLAWILAVSRLCNRNRMVGLSLHYLYVFLFLFLFLCNMACTESRQPCYRIMCSCPPHESAHPPSTPIPVVLRPTMRSGRSLATIRLIHLRIPCSRLLTVVEAGRL